MRILQLTDSLNPGGAERMAVNIANALAASGHDAFLCSTRQEGLLKSAIAPQVNYLFLNKRSATDIRALRKLLRFVKTQKIDIIHAHATSYFSATLVKLMYPKIHLIWHDHYGNSEALEERSYVYLKICSTFFSTILCVNEKLLIWNQQKLYTNKVIYLSNFVVEKTDGLGLLNLKGSHGKRILCVANLRPQKDYVTLIKATKDITKDYPEWTLHCVGYDFEDVYSAKIKRLVKALDLESKVFFYGTRLDVESFMRTCDIAVLSSKSEGLPLVLLEYGMLDLPVIATAVGDCYKVIKHKETGLLIVPEDVPALVNAISGLLTDDKLRTQLARNLKVHVRRDFGFEKAMKVLSLIYRNTLTHT